MRGRKIIAIVLFMLLILTIVTGCESEDKKDISKGRYIEESYSLPNGFKNIMNMSILDNGDLILVGNNKDGSFEVYISKDDGESWSNKEINLLIGEAGDEIDIQSLIVGSNDRVYVQYARYTKEQLEFMNNYNPEDKDKVWDKEKMKPEVKFIVINEDESIIDINLDNKEAEYIINMKFSKDGDLFFEAITDGGTKSIYQLDKNSMAIKNKYKISEDTMDYCLLDKSLITIDYDKLNKYNLKTGKSESTIKELNKSSFNMTGICADEKKTIYFADSKGVSKYNTDNKKTKLIIDSSLTSFGDDNMTLEKLLVNEKEELLAVYRQSTDEHFVLKKYKYDSKVASKPGSDITVYSLYEDSSIKQAVMLYQKAHPDIFINYEIGITYDEEGNESISENDAIKIINTEFLAGKGPDVILLDNLPGESYKAKDLLEDITDIINKNGKDLFRNIVGAYIKDDKILSCPLSFKIPIIYGKNMGEVEDLNDLVKEVENIENNDGKIIDAFTPEEMVAMLYPYCEKSWINENKTINEEKLEEFLDDVKRIYDINSNAITEEDRQVHEKDKNEILEHVNEDEYLDYMYLNRSGGKSRAFDDLSPKIDFGNINYEEMLVFYENIKADPININSNAWGGQIGKNFIPKSEVAVAKNSKNKDEAKDFLQFLFSEEFQKADKKDSFSINKTIVQGNLMNMKEDEGSYGIGADENGEGEIQVNINRLSNEQINSFIKMVEELKVPYSFDKNIYDKISKKLEDFVAGKASEEKTVKLVKDNLKIYLSE